MKSPNIDRKRRRLLSTKREKLHTASTTRGKSESVTFRIESEALRNLRHEAGQKDISTNTLVNKLIKDHLNWHSNAAKASFIPVRRLRAYYKPFKLCCLFFKYTTFLCHTTHVVVNNMVIVSSNRIFMNKPKVDDVNSVLETSTVCPLCKVDDAIITDPKSGEVICSKCGMVILDKSLERKTHWQRNTTEGIARTGLARHDMGFIYSYWKGKHGFKQK